MSAAVGSDVDDGVVDDVDACRRRVEGCLLGTAVGDALGLPCEGLKPGRIARRFMPLDRYRLFGRLGFVSDDTEQSALVAAAIARGRVVANDDVVVDIDEIVRDFRLALLGWFWRMPFGVGLATVRAALKLSFGLKNSGVSSAGNGAAMRSAVIGAVFFGPRHRATRRALAEALARVTHTDERAVEAAVFVAHVAGGDEHALADVKSAELSAALNKASDLADANASVADAAAAIGTSGFVMHSVPFAWFCLCRFGFSFDAVTAAIEGGGDTDTNAAIVGGWVGGQSPTVLPPQLVADLIGGPFGPWHLRAIAASVSARQRPPRYLWPLALLRNLSLYPVILVHGFRRLLP